MKTLFPLPAKLTPGMRLKSKRGSIGFIVVTQYRDRSGEQLFRMRYKRGKFLVLGQQLFTWSDLEKSGCRLMLPRKDAEMYALSN